MLVRLETLLPCSAERAWVEVQKVALLTEVARPLVTFAAVRGELLPERWTEDSVVRIRSYLFGLIPLGARKLAIERLHHERCEIQTRESDALIRRWDHRISIAPLDRDSCVYTDEVEIDAGVLTLVVWLFAQWLFHHRHRRWQRVAERLRARPASATLDGEIDRRRTRA